MATVRIYKVAELLDTTSQEVLALLKRDHGIELKSASSTIEEVVARSFVERVARQRNISLPGGDMFAEHPAPAKGGKKAALPKRPEPPKPAAPVLGPPRLVKTIKPIVHADEAPPAAPAAEAAPPAAPAAATSPVHAAPPAAPPVEAVVEEPPTIAPAAPVAAAAPEPVEAVAPPAVPAPPPAEEVQIAAMASEASEAAPSAPGPAGRFVPPTLRLRIEEPGQTPQPVRPLTPAKRPQVSQPRIVQPPAPAAAKPGAPASTARPPAGSARPGSQAPPRPGYPAAARPSPPASMLGGPRPLPSQPVRQQPSQQARPGMPGQPPARPPFGQPSRPPFGQQRPGQRPVQSRRERPSAPMMPSAPAAPPPITRTITLAEGMTVKDLADKLDVRVKDVLAKLLMKRMMMTINSTLDIEVAKDIAKEFGAEVEMRSFEEELVSAEGEESRPEDLIARAPVVTVMGHVDHGKTSLLDAIRETKVAEREAGGITQHIGAYHVDVGDGRSVVFLDTPGHEAFTLMRARGAKVTDVVVLVVAADDGVMPQTREAIDHARAANVPIVVAINKIDKAGANADNVKRELAELNLVPEDWGGQTVMVPVSAKKRQNLDQLLEMILLSTDILELKANPKRSASGTVLEAKLDRGRGPVATVLVQDGTLNVGDNFIAGPVVGRVRNLIDDRGRPVKSAAPATPVEVLGLTSLPQPGDPFQTVADAAKARQIATFRQAQAKERALGAKGGRLTLESLKEQIAEGGMKELPIIVKADVQGSAEVLADTLTKLSDERVKIRIIRSGVGAINESDVLLASASNAIIIGFNVRPDRNAQDTAEREEVDVRLHSVIYNVTEEIKKGMAGLLEPTFKEVRIGTAEVREVFRVPKVGSVAGCMVVEGRITRAGETQARLLRDNVVVFEGKIASLRRFKDDVSEVKAGFECGISLERFNDIKDGDVIEVFSVERVPVMA
ncbi:MAG TPA: translation initiation factor IF-2 [Vicinamibacterales bacterium]|nr:translation initiation factor IF-2 [Vicinamibacterales bacterium]